MGAETVNGRMTTFETWKQWLTRKWSGADNRELSLKRRALEGSAWTLGGYGCKQSLRLGSHLVLAWLLVPQAFGLMALVKVVQHGLNMFSDIGIKPAIIQNPRGDQTDFLNTAWTIQIIRGFVLWLCACILAWPFASLFARNDPAASQLLYLLPVAGFAAVFQGFNSTALATLNRHLRLGRLTMLEISAQLISLTVMITWALIQPTVWALVAGGLSSAAFKMISSHFIVPGVRVRVTWNRECAAELLGFGKWIFLSTVFTFLALNLDKLILGKILTLHELGLYSIAYVFALVALVVSTQLGGTVLFPVYSRYQNDVKRMMSVALRAREAVLWAGVAVCITMAVASPLFFQLLWPIQYHDAGLIAQWMSMYIWTMILLQTMDRVPLALGNSRALFFSNLWRCLGIMLAVVGYFIAALPGFLVGLAVGPVIAHLYLLYHVPTHRLAMAGQGARFTVGGLAYGLPAVVMTGWVMATTDVWTSAAAVFIAAAMPLLVAAWMVWKCIQGRERRSSAAPLVAVPDEATT
jgi:O-antigen/teichoic acid export membrane protein